MCVSSFTKRTEQSWAATRTIEYRSNDAAYQESDRLRRWSELRREQSLSFLRERGQIEGSPGIMADLCASSAWCPLSLYKNTQRRSLLRVKHWERYHSCLCLYWSKGILLTLKGSLHAAHMAADNRSAMISVNNKRRDVYRITVWNIYGRFGLNSWLNAHLSMSSQAVVSITLFL